MNVAVDKVTLAKLEAKRGQLCMDNGQVFKRLVGSLHIPTSKYRCSLEFAPAGDDAASLAKFSVAELVEFGESPREVPEVVEPSPTPEPVLSLDDGKEDEPASPAVAPEGGPSV